MIFALNDAAFSGELCEMAQNRMECKQWQLLLWWEQFTKVIVINDGHTEPSLVADERV
jgi:hypothetical protein